MLGKRLMVQNDVKRLKSLHWRGYRYKYLTLFCTPKLDPIPSCVDRFIAPDQTTQHFHWALLVQSTLWGGLKNTPSPETIKRTRIIDNHSWYAPLESLPKNFEIFHPIRHFFYCLSDLLGGIIWNFSEASPVVHIMIGRKLLCVSLNLPFYQSFSINSIVVRHFSWMTYT